MSIARLVEVSHYYGPHRVFGPISASIEPGDRIGLIGPNGGGKTTLVRLLAGVKQPTEGEVRVARRSRLGYLVQERIEETDVTPFEYIKQSMHDINALAGEMRDLEQRMTKASDAEHVEKLMKRYAVVSEKFERAGGYNVDTEIRATLFGLGFREHDIERPIHSLSGGEQTRVALARLLVVKPELLLLDEPTNHLDVQAIEWLESYCQSYRGALLVVSHDRYFLDATVQRIWELDEYGEFAVYRGNYSAALHQRTEQRERRLAEYKQQQDEIERLEAYVQKYRAGNRATMARSRQRRLERMERISAPTAEPSQMRLQLTAGNRGSREVVKLDRVHFSYGQKQIITDLSMTVERGERIGIIGPNGSGKSTLLSLLIGRLKPTRGEAYVGRDIHIGFLEQETELFSEENTVLDEVLNARRMPVPDARDYLARFLFRNDDVFKLTSVLSGGEKRRLTLAKLLLHSNNVLCLDEPTNHLDIITCETLEEALEAYEGTLLFVSHDRYFVSRLAKCLIIVHGDGNIEMFSGTYAEYEAKRKEEAHERRWQEQKERRKRTRSAMSSQKTSRGHGTIRRRVEELEENIEQLEHEKEKLEAQLADVALYTDETETKRVTSRYNEVSGALDEAYGEWERLVSQLAES